MSKSQKARFIIDEKYKDLIIINIKSRFADPEVEQAANDDLANILKLSEEDINSLYQEALTQANNNVFGKALCTNADFQSWSEEDYWTTREAAWLNIDINPKLIPDSVISEYYAHLPSVQRYLELKEKLDKAQGVWKLGEFCITAKTKPISFIEWGTDKKRPFPKELEKLVKKQFKSVKQTKNVNFAVKDKKRGNGSQTQRQNNNLLKILYYILENKFSYMEGKEEQVATELHKITGGSVVSKGTLKKYLVLASSEVQVSEKKELEKSKV